MFQRGTAGGAVCSWPGSGANKWNSKVAYVEIRRIRMAHQFAKLALLQWIR